MIRVSLNNEIHLLFLTLLSDKVPAAASEPFLQRKRQSAESDIQPL